MPISVPVPDKTAGDVFTETMWDSFIRDNINKLLDRGHRVLTVAQFLALTGLEDGDEVYVEVDSTNGVMWHFRYVAADPTSFKWRFLGGPPLVSYVATEESVNSASFVALATAGPSIALPRSGDYDVVIGTYETGGSGGAMSYDIGGTAATAGDQLGSNWFGMFSERRARKTGLAPVTLTAKYKASPASSFGYRTMHVSPARIRHDA